jgi:RNA polymerase sigma-70 factor (ECF subfamily)
VSSFSDAGLIARIISSDDRNAFKELVRRYQSDVRGLLRRLTGDTHLADDLAQETFIRAYRGLKKYQGQAKFSTWIYRIANNVFFSSFRGNREMICEDELPEPCIEEEFTQYDLITGKIDIERAMKTLSLNEKSVIIFYYSKGMTHEEVADVLEMPLGTVKTNLNRAKLKMLKAMTVDVKGF